jgi:hypothetical protein
VHENFDKDDYISDSDDYDAVLQSLLQPNAAEDSLPQPLDEDEDRRLIKEVLQFSKIEEAKKEGKINLDHLKRKNKEVAPAESVKDLRQPKTELLQMPAIFNGKKASVALQPIEFNAYDQSPSKHRRGRDSPSTAKDTQLQMEPSYGFLPGSMLDHDDLGMMDDILKHDDTKKHVNASQRNLPPVS